MREASLPLSSALRPSSRASSQAFWIRLPHSLRAMNTNLMPSLDEVMNSSTTPSSRKRSSLHWRASSRGSSFRWSTSSTASPFRCADFCKRHLPRIFCSCSSPFTLVFTTFSLSAKSSATKMSPSSEFFTIAAFFISPCLRSSRIWHTLR